jgi:hypothetical protein
MENKPKRSKALIITIIVLILLLIFGYLIYKNRDAFGVKTSASIAKIFSPLISSTNSKNLSKINENSQRTSAQAGEDIKGGDNVSVSGSDSNNNPIIMKSKSGDIVFGFASQDIANGDIGEVIINSGASNTFWDSFSGFLGGILGGNNGGTTPPPAANSCTNGATNYPMCTTSNGGSCINNATNPPLCTIIGGICINGATNPPLCTIIGGICINGATNPPLCTINSGGLCINNATNPPLCTIIGGICINGATNPPLCTTVGGACMNGADNPPDCNTINGECMNGETNPPACMTGGAPDLIAGAVTPTIAIINKPTILSSTITNIGSGSTGSSFTSFFTVTTVSTGESATANVVIPLLDVSVKYVSTVSYTFNTNGNYSIRVCADKSSSSDAGTIAESNENNNCGPWTTLTVTNPLPLPCSLPKITNTETGQCINASDCKSPKVINGNKCEVDPNACLSPKITDTETSQCINASDCKSPKVVNGNKCEVPPETVNECLLIDKHPLTFTDDEQAQLAELLRKFYLIAPNLKTEDDINIAYTTITQYQNFSDQLSTLINQCYAQTADPAYIAAGGPTLRFGNPWYKYSTLRGSYIDKTFDCKYVYGWFTGNGADGKNCDTYNQGLYSTPQAPASCTKTSNFISNYNAGLRNKCMWNPGANILDLEKISNIW